LVAIAVVIVVVSIAIDSIQFHAVNAVSMTPEYHPGDSVTASRFAPLVDVLLSKFALCPLLCWSLGRRLEIQYWEHVPDKVKLSPAQLLHVF